ncbi:hypothetical protein ABTL70_20155, partial [Acinetobacter baumannii]
MRGHQWRTGRAQLATDGDTRGPAVLSRLVDRTLVAALGRRARVALCAFGAYQAGGHDVVQTG